MPHLERYYQAQIHQILGHNLRSKQTQYKSADRNLESQNDYYINNGNGLEICKGDNKALMHDALKYQKALVDSTPHVKRKTLVVGAEWVVTCPKDLPSRDQHKFLKSAMDFMQERYGAKSMICATMHFDEPRSQPHLHLVFTPIDKTNRICARNVLTRSELKTYHPALEKYVSNVLGYPVHILREPEERTKISLPLSQYKVETLAKEVAEKSKINKILLKTAREQAEKESKEKYKELEGKGFLGKMRGDYKDIAKASIVSAETARALINAEREQYKNELEREYQDRVNKVKSDEEENARHASEIEQKEKALSDEKERLEKWDQELQNRLEEVNRIAKDAEEKERKASEKEKQAKRDKEYADSMKSTISNWQEEREKWVSIEEANVNAKCWKSMYENEHSLRLSDLATHNTLMDKKDAQISRLNRQHNSDQNALKQAQKDINAQDKQIADLHKSVDISNDKLADYPRLKKLTDKQQNAINWALTYGESAWDIAKNTDLSVEQRSVLATMRKKALSSVSTYTPQMPTDAEIEVFRQKIASKKRIVSKSRNSGKSR